MEGHDRRGIEANNKSAYAMITTKSPDQLAREDLIRQTLEAAAKRLECIHGNKTYKRAWQIAAREIRDLGRILVVSQ